MEINWRKNKELILSQVKKELEDETSRVKQMRFVCVFLSLFFVRKNAKQKNTNTNIWFSKENNVLKVKSDDLMEEIKRLNEEKNGILQELNQTRFEY